jgi:TPR repeat protein
MSIVLDNPEYAGHNPKKGIQLLRQSAEQGYTPAQSILGMLYYSGEKENVQQNWKQARFWFRRAAKQGDSVAQYYLGEIYDGGNGVPMNRKEAFQWYKRSSDGGCMPAAQKLAHCYLNGIGTRKDERAGYLMLAVLRLRGDEESGALLRSAATSGNPAAEFAMWVYDRERKDMASGRNWLEKSAGKGNADALCGLAVLYESEDNHEQKLYYFRLASEKGSADAQYRLGLLLENVFDRMAPENEEAFKWIKAASDQGHSHAHYILGNLYRDGTWVDVDIPKAVECYFKAASMGESDGIDRLGECYAFGVGVPKDANLAFQYFQRAADLGNPKGLCNLGICYLHGRGCRQDTEFAFRWISRAVGTGNPIVFQMLRSIGLDMSLLSNGYKQSQKLLSTIPGMQFGQALERLDNPKSLTPKPPET